MAAAHGERWGAAGAARAGRHEAAADTARQGAYPQICS